MPFQQLLNGKSYREIDLENDKFHYFKWSRRNVPINHEYRYRNLLDALKVPYFFNNDAKRGGRNGDYIEITPNGKKILSTIRKEFYLIKKANKDKYYYSEILNEYRNLWNNI